MRFEDALRALAARIETEGSIRAAVAGWPELVSGPLAPAVADVAARVRLGASVHDSLQVLACAVGDDARRLAAIVHHTSSFGGSAATAVRGLAASLERRASHAALARAASAGARASSRLLAWLPLAALLLFAADRSVLDDLGIGLGACGLALAIAGSRWIDRLTPQAPVDGAATRVAELAAVLLDAGGQLPVVLNAIADSSAHPEIRPAASRVRLGLSWPAALMRSDDEELASLGRLLLRCTKSGLPTAAALRVFVAERRDSAGAEFERRTRAAPIHMVVPLVVCGLPAFCLTTIAPLLRALPLG